MRQLMGAGKAEPSCAGIFFTEGRVHQDRACPHREQSIFMALHIIDRLQAVIKNGLAQDAAVFPQVLILQGEPVGFDQILDGNGGGLAVIEPGIIGGQHPAGNILDPVFTVKQSHHSHPLCHASFRFVSRSINSCHSSSVASTSLAVRRAARTMSRSMMYSGRSADTR